MCNSIIGSTITVKEFKRKYEIDEDVPTDLTKLFGIFNVSSLPKVFNDDPENYIMCEFSTDNNGRKAIHYREEFLCSVEYPDRTIPVCALIHHLISGEENFCITQKTRLSEQEKLFVYELLIPEEKMNEIIERMNEKTGNDKSHIIPVLSKIFRVSPDLVEGRLEFSRYNAKDSR